MNSDSIEALASAIREFTERPGGTMSLNILGLTKKDILAAVSRGFVVAPAWDGAITDVVSGDDVTDHGKNDNYFSFHTDGVYYTVPPHWVILYCAQTGGTGGKTFFSSTKSVIADLRESYDANLLESINVVYMERTQQRCRHPLIESIGGQEVLRWSTALYLEPDIAKLSEPNRKSFTSLLPRLMGSINSFMASANCYLHTWNPGDILIFDNRSLVHGRTKIEDPERERHLYRVFFDQDKLELASRI